MARPRSGQWFETPRFARLLAMRPIKSFHGDHAEVKIEGTKQFQEDIMARLRHIAVCVKDLDKAAAFYEKVFEFKKIAREDLEIGSAIYMSDGVINMALLNFKGKGGEKASDLKEGQAFVGAHHFGIQVDDLAEAQKKIEAAGGKFFFTLGKTKDEANFEMKFKDPDGVIFDISEKGWLGTGE